MFWEMISPWDVVSRQVDLYVLGDDFTMGCSFQTGGLAYDRIPLLGLSLQSSIEFIQNTIGFTQKIP